MPKINESDRQRLLEIQARLEKTTPAPWYVNCLDDSHHMNLVAVTTKPDENPHLVANKSIRETFVATTLLQGDLVEGKPFVEVDVDEFDYLDSSKGGRWDEDAEFIAHAREDIPFLLELINQLLGNTKEPPPHDFTIEDLRKFLGTTEQVEVIPHDS